MKLLCILLFISFSAHADIVDDLGSPVTTGARVFLLSGTVLTVGIIASQDTLSGPWETSVAKNKPLGKSSKYGDAMGQMVPNAIYAGGMWVSSYLGNEDGLFYAWDMVEATAYSALIAQVIKYSVSEGRPYNSQTGSSFPSGHATSAFAFAGIVAAEHEWYYGVPALGLATFVAYSRINDNQHRLHDVTAGATIGLTCAMGIYFSHNQRHKLGSNIQLMPAPIPGGAGIMAAWNY